MKPKRQTRAAGHGGARDRKQAQSWSAAQPKHSTAAAGAKAPPAGSEHHLQAAVAEFLGFALPPHEAVFCSIPNGGKRNKGTAGKLKAEGLQSGAPDLLILWRGRAIGLELKTGKGRLSPQQMAFSMRWTTAGGLYAVARSLEEVADLLDAAGVPLRARIGGGAS
jgi:hypothetical protein